MNLFMLLDITILSAISLYILTTTTKYAGHFKLKNRKISYWVISLILLFAFCLFSGFISSLALLCSIIFISASYFLNNGVSTLVRMISGTLAVVIYLALGFRLLPGFENQLLIDNASLKGASTSYTSYFNFDKTLAGLIFYLLVVDKAWKKVNIENALKCVLVSIVLVFVVLSLGYTFNIIDFNFEYRFDYKFVLLFIVIQLFSTCLAEEVLFRGFIQERLYGFFNKNSVYSKSIPLLISSILFGLVHFAGGVKYMFVATLAGLGYGLVYQISRKVEYAIFAHALLNLCHLLFFTYPLLAAK